MREEPSHMEKLVREKDQLEKTVRTEDYWLLSMRLRDNPQVRKNFATRVVELFFPAKPHREEELLPNEVLDDFYAFVNTRIRDRRERIYAIEQELANPQQKEETDGK